MTGRFVAVLAAACLGSAAASAQTAAPPALQRDSGWDCDPRHETWRQADMQVVGQAMQAGLQGAADRLPQLQAILAHAPAAPWPVAEICGPQLVVHMDNPLAAMIAGSGILSAEAKAGTPDMPRQAVPRPMPYVVAALLVGSLDDEAQRYDAARIALERGAGFAPGDPSLAVERAFALGRLHRNGEAIGVVDAALAANPRLPPKAAARLQRSRGFALGELGRYDEALVAYQTSQALDPDDRLSANEILYLQGRKGGLGPSPVVSLTSEKATARPKP